ncbi:MAG: glycoside hydrolase family 44 protein [Bryobacteraceae bacterium]
MKNPISVLRVVLSLSLVLSPSGGSISAQNSQAGGSAAAQQLPPHKFVPATRSNPTTAVPAKVRQPEAAVSGPNLTIDAGSGRHLISPYIYGINYNQNQIPDINPSIIRWGGDATSQYNWQNGNTNAGNDWYFINSNQNSGTDAPDFDTFFTTNHAAGVQTIGTIPINGWVANSTVNACGFSVKKYGAQQKTDPYNNTDCGNGILLDGNPVTQEKTTDPTDADVQVNPGFMQDWVAHTVSTFSSSANGGVAIWELDNEPTWWSGVHQNIHSANTDYDEVWQKGLAYAQAVKAADPTAKVAGPITAGWSDLFFSRVDLQSGWGTAPYLYWDNPTDRMAHGNQDFVAWYLQQFANYEKQNGQRLLDYFDIHAYMPGTGTGLSATDATDPATNAARFESTRVFWDETFTPPGTNEYILNTPSNSYNNPNAPCICLIPRMKNWVSANYPDTKLSITEYNLGAQGDINGALAETDVLGIFGREGLDVATMWPFLGYPDIPLKAPITYAFRMYRNYDGAKSTFGETGVSAVSVDQSQLSVYAAQRTSDSALTVMVINKTANDLTSSVSLANFSPQSTAKVFRYSAANLTAVQPQPNQAVTPTGFSATFPANSATLLVIPESAPASITASPNPIPVATGATVGQTTISWNAPGSSSVEVHVGSATGTILGEGTSTGSAQTGDWVTNGMVFVLVDGTTHATLATTTVTLTTGETATISANPNPIPVAAGVTVGQTTINWNAPGSNNVEVHVNSAAGPVLSGGSSIGSAQTGDWVTDGMVFVLVDATSHAPLATTTISLETSGGTPTITANPNPIPGVTVGQTTITWTAPGYSSVEVHVGSATGTLFAAGGSSGSAQTGDWVTNGMEFVLVNGTTHGTLATTTVTLGTSGGTPTLTANPNPAPGAEVGQTTISWNAPGSSAVEVHVGTASGTLFAAGGSSGSAMTGDWVSNGMVFVLVDANTHTQLASTTVGLTGS